MAHRQTRPVRPPVALLLALLVAPSVGVAAVPPSPVEVHVRLQVPFVGGHEPIGIASIGGDLGLTFWERWAIEGRLIYGTDLAGTGWSVGGAFGPYWTILDFRDADRVGGHFSIPVLLGFEHFDTDHDCTGEICATRLSGFAPQISTGVSFVYWTRWSFGFNLRILLTGGTAIVGTATDVETGVERDLDGGFGYGSSGRLTWGISF